MTLVDRLAAAGCVAADDEAAELRAAAGSDTVALETMVRRREAGEPLAWIVGSIDFGGVRVHVAPGVYVPRLQSLPLAREAVRVLPTGGTGVDLCTGSGAIAAYVQAQRPDGRVFATDNDERAVTCARTNGVDAYAGDLFDPLPPTLHGGVDVLTAVAPYVPTEAVAFLPRDVQAYEPVAALDGGPDGLAIVRRIVADAPRWLRAGGSLLLEIGGDQAAIVAPLLGAAGFVDVTTLVDDEGDDRSVSARLP